MFKLEQNVCAVGGPLPPIANALACKFGEHNVDPFPTIFLAAHDALAIDRPPSERLPAPVLLIGLVIHSFSHSRTRETDQRGRTPTSLPNLIGSGEWFFWSCRHTHMREQS
jgi:hypothetical protein